MSRITTIAIFGATALLAGCGGGGGGSSSSGVSYSGSTQQAVITSDASAAQASSTVYGKNRVAGKSLHSASALQSELLQQVTENALSLVASTKSMAAGVAINETAQGSCGGSASIKGDITRDSTGQMIAPSNATITYSSFCFTDSAGAQVTTSGAIQLAITDTATARVEKFTTSSLSTKTSSGTVILNGSYTFYYDLAGNPTSSEYRYDYQNTDGKVYRAGDSTTPVTFTFDSSHRITSITGLFCDPNVNGCVTVSTPTAPGYAPVCLSGNPSSGTIKLTGGNGANGQATFVTLSPQADCTNVKVCWGEGTTNTNCTLTAWSQF